MDALINNRDNEPPVETATGAKGIRWRLGVLAACVVSLLSLVPQLHLWASRGGQWGHAVAYNQGLGDEVAYAAYINALIDGRPRLSDPYTGRDKSSSNRLQPESLFSIQFIPAYAIALPARALGISATTAFIVLSPLVAFASALALFWLIALVTGNDDLAATGVLVILCLGALAAGEGMINSWAGGNTHFDFFPFLRRYQPAASFPLFLLLFVCVWRALASEKNRLLVPASAAGILFGLIVFSYFYLWTAAAAWLAVLAVLWLIARPGDRVTVIRSMTVIGSIAIAALVPYLILISRRSETAESVQALVLSRRPDFSVAELISGLLLLALVIAIARGRIEARDRRVIFAASFALLPFIVLNQQIITGRVMQPIHYKGFVTNYSVLIALVLTTGLQWRKGTGQGWKLSKRALVWIALAAFEWGSIESYQAAKRSAGANERAADEMAVYVRLNEEARKHSSISGLVVLFNDLRMADGAPAASPFAVLWAPHLVVYSGTTTTESKERLYRHLYYTGVDVKDLDDYFKGRNVYYGCAVGLFGFDRLIDGLNPNAKPISAQEKWMMSCAPTTPMRRAWTGSASNRDFLCCDPGRRRAGSF